MEIDRPDPTLPTMSQMRAKHQPRVLGKGRLRRRNVKLANGLASRGLNYSDFALMFPDPSAKHSKKKK